MDASLPRANWAVVREGRIVRTGLGPTPSRPAAGWMQVIDCRGRTVLPGFIDAHLHVEATAQRCVTLDLAPYRGLRSLADIQAAVAERAGSRPPGTWIIGGGYCEFNLAEKRHPNRWDLDAVAPEHPVKLTHRSGHAHVLNSLALARVGISLTTSDPVGGMIDRSLDTGEPTGLLFEMGKYLARRVPRLDPRDLERGVKETGRRLLSHGVTTIHDATAGNGPDQWRQFEHWITDGLFGPRVVMMLGRDAFNNFRAGDYRTEIPHGRLRLGAVKFILDETTGRLHPALADLSDQVRRVHLSGRQVAIHAIEETAVEAAAEAVARALSVQDRADHRHRIEHASVCPQELAEKLASLGIAVVTQPGFIRRHGGRYLETVPKKQLPHLYPIRSLVRTGIPVAFGSDSPIADADPLASIGAAVTRRSEDGRTLLPDQGVTVEQALRMHTAGAAWVGFDEKVYGAITPGYWADMVVLNDDPTVVPPEIFGELKVDLTILGGKVVFRREDD